MGKFSRKSVSLCTCGCGGLINPGNRFISTHNFRLPHTEEFKKRWSERFKVDNPMFRPEAREKISKATKGISKHTEESKEKLRQAHLGKIHSEETKRKISFGCKKFFAEHPEIVDKVTWKKGRKHLEETKRKIGQANSGTNNGQWKGGSSFDPYLPDFNRGLKQRVRKRDNYSCICRRRWRKGIRVFPVHHIDYNKENCKDDNLITLCMPCHNKTTGGDRALWKERLERVMREKSQSLRLQ